MFNISLIICLRSSRTFQNLFTFILSDIIEVFYNIITILVSLQIYIAIEVSSFFLFNIHDLIIKNYSIDNHNDCIDAAFDDDDQVVEIEQEEAADLSGNKDLEDNEDANDIEETLIKDNT